MKRCGTVYLAAKKSVKMKWLLLCTIFLLLAISVNSISDNDDDEDEFSDGEDVIENNELPEHEFITIEKIVKSGKDKGKKKYTTTLMIPPYAFKRKTDRKIGGNAIFKCNSCWLNW